MRWPSAVVSRPSRSDRQVPAGSGPRRTPAPPARCLVEPATGGKIRTRRVAVVTPQRPLKRLAEWLQAASDAGLPEHDAAVLATADVTCRPTARTVSLRRVEDGAVVFTTATWTRKA